MSYTKELVGEAAEMLTLGYTDHEIVRILRIPPSTADSFILQAEQWNDTTFVPYTVSDLDDMADYFGA